MIKFDTDSIYKRAISRLQDDPEWKAVINNSVVDALLKSNSEAVSEAARYAEYLFKESKWDTAQNDSSILAMAGMLGYKPRRKVSATGQIYVSADPIIHRTGTTVPVSELKKLVTSPSSSSFYSRWRVIPSGVTSSSNTFTIKDSSGNSYVALKNLSQACSAANPVVTLDILQGKRKYQYVSLNTIRNTATQSKLDSYLYVPVRIPDCEDASNSLSRGFFKVYTVSTAGYLQEYRVVDSLLLSESSDRDVEVYNDLYSRDLFYLKFNADTSRGSTLNITDEGNLAGLRIDYVESLGSEGNVADVFRAFTISDIGSTGAVLYGTNLAPITGGMDAETPEEIKVNAPKHYIKGYTAGTKESYENAILNMTIPYTSQNLKPTAVHVYGGTYRDSDNNLSPATMVTFIANGLDDLASVDDGSGVAYESINKYLNYYLAKIKSPQDTLRFVLPDYVAFSLGITCRVNRDTVVDLNALKLDVRDYLNSKYGAASNSLNFGRNIYPSSISAEIQQNFSSVVSTSVNIEAIKKLNWYDATLVSPGDDGTGGNAGDSIIHTIRVPFSFNSVFRGNQTFKGFRDYKTGASYIMRVDVMYKKPTTLTSTGKDYHISIFVPEDTSARQADTNNLRPFYCIKEKNNLWRFNDPGVVAKDTDYGNLEGITEIKNGRMVYYRQRSYDDNAYNADIGNNSEILLDSYLTSLGAIDDYLIYFNGDYTSSTSAGNGFVEFSIDPIYMLLQTVFAPASIELAKDLAACPLSQLKCGTSDPSITDKFKKILADYVDVYVSMIPNDPDLVVSGQDNAVLYIDSSDTTMNNTISNISSTKLNRMISVTCEYV